MIATSGLLFISACGGGNGSGTTATAAGSGLPLTFENCGKQVTIDKPPERVVLLGPSAIPLLKEVDALDSVVSISGRGTLEIFDPETQAQVKDIPTPGGGGAEEKEVSLEELIATTPDVVIGSLEGAGLATESVEQAGITTIEIPSFCNDEAVALQDPSFEDVYSQLELYGRLFGNEDRAAAAVADLRARVATAQKSTTTDTKETAAALYLTAGSPPTAYGTGAVVDAQMQALGLSNVFGDIRMRDFDASAESIIAKDPDVIIALYIKGANINEDPQEAVRAVRNLPGAETITAVRNDDIVPLQFYYTDPPTPLSVVGLEELAAALAAGD